MKKEANCKMSLGEIHQQDTENIPESSYANTDLNNTSPQCFLKMNPTFHSFHVQRRLTTAYDTAAPSTSRFSEDFGF